MKTEGINERIKFIREKLCNGSNAEFAEKVGIPRTKASSLCSREPYISDAMLMKILNAFPEVNKNWLFWGEGEFSQKRSFENITDLPRITTKPVDDGIKNIIESYNKIIADLVKTIHNQNEQINNLINK